MPPVFKAAEYFPTFAGHGRETGVGLLEPGNSTSSPSDLPYRTLNGMQKIKNQRTQSVVGGFRYNEGKPVVGSLLLGFTMMKASLITSASRRHSPRARNRIDREAAPLNYAARVHRGAGRPEPWSTEHSA